MLVIFKLAPPAPGNYMSIKEGGLVAINPEQVNTVVEISGVRTVVYVGQVEYSVAKDYETVVNALSNAIRRYV